MEYVWFVYLVYGFIFKLLFTKSKVVVLVRHVSALSSLGCPRSRHDDLWQLDLQLVRHCLQKHGLPDQLRHRQHLRQSSGRVSGEM